MADERERKPALADDELQRATRLELVVGREDAERQLLLSGIRNRTR